MNTRLFLFCFLFVWLPHTICAQVQMPAMLQMVLESSHWDRFYCQDNQDRPLLAGIITDNLIPMYSSIQLHGTPVDMYSAAPDPGSRHFLVIKKCKLNQESVLLKFVYDKRLRVKFKLRRTDESEWSILSSTFRQRTDCLGKKGSKSFSWNF